MLVIAKPNIVRYSHYRKSIFGYKAIKSLAITLPCLLYQFI